MPPGELYFSAAEAVGTRRNCWRESHTSSSFFFLLFQGAVLRNGPQQSQGWSGILWATRAARFCRGEISAKSAPVGIGTIRGAYIVKAGLLSGREVR